MSVAHLNALQRPVLRYHGGKWRQAAQIIDLMPAHNIYVEPFTGAASVLLQKAISPIEVINDKYDRIVNVFRVLRDSILSEKLQQQLRLTPYSESEYRACREVSPDPVEDARRMLVLGHQGHGSTAASGGKRSGWRRNVRENIRSAASEWQSIPEQVSAWAAGMRGVYIEADDAGMVIDRWDTPETLFYVDPPYLASTRTQGLRGYAHEMTEQDHIDLATKIHGLHGNVILSGYSSDLYDNELYAHWQRVSFPARADKGRQSTEVCWISPGAEMQGRLF